MEDAVDFIKGPQWEADNKVLEHAKEILRKRICPKKDVFIKHKDELHNYLMVRVGGLQHEAFGIVFFGLRGEVLACEEMFRGTLDHTPVFPREVAKAALRHNAAAVVLYHNHPSASHEPSNADIEVTLVLHRAMKMIGVDLLDHVIVAGDKVASVADLGHMPGRRKFADIPPQAAALLQLLGIRPEDVDQLMV